MSIFVEMVVSEMKGLVYRWETHQPGYKGQRVGTGPNLPYSAILDLKRWIELLEKKV